MQAVCSKILKARENIEEYQKLIEILRLVLKHADARGLQECLDYVLFPFAILLDAFISNHGKEIFEALKKDSVVCDTLLCLDSLVSKSQHLEEGQVVSLTQRLASMLALPKERLSEEPRTIISSILAKIFSKICSQGDAWLGKAEYRPLIGSVVSILLSHPYNDATVPSDIAIDVQKSSLDALVLFLRAVNNADSLAFFVPGVVTGLVKRIMVQIDENAVSGLVRSKNSSGVIVSLRVMQELFVHVFSDKVVEPFVDEGAMEECSTASTVEKYQSMLEHMAQGVSIEKSPPQNSAEALNNLEANIETDKDTLHVKVSWSWIQATVIRISTFLQIIVPKLSCHDNPAVRLQIAEMSSCILLQCLIAFKDNRFILDALLLLGQDSWPSVKFFAGSCLASYFEENDHSSLIDVGDLLDSLPDILRESERKGRAEALRISSCLEYSHVGPENSALHLLNSAEGRDRILEYVSICFDLDIQPLLIVARGPLLAIMDTEYLQGSSAQQTHIGRSSMPDCLKYILSKETYAAFATMIHQMVKVSLENDICDGKITGSCYTGLIASSLKNITDALHGSSNDAGGTRPWQLEVSKTMFFLTEIFDGSIRILESEHNAPFGKNALSCCKNAVLDILYTFQEQRIWLLKSAFVTHTAKVDDENTLNAILQHYCLDFIGVAARCLKLEFSSDGKCMHAAMLPVIEKFASDYQYVSASAKSTIQSICSFCGYQNGLEDLIHKNIDYVVDGMCIRLRQPSLYPDAPKLFASLLKQNGVAVALMPLLAEPADHAIKGISIIHRREKPENVLSFVLCTVEVAQGTYQVATAAHEEMDALVQRILAEETTVDITLDSVEDLDNPSIEEIAGYFQTKQKDATQYAEPKQIDVTPDVWERLMLCKKRLSSAASLAQSISDSVGPLSVSKSLPVAVQSFKAAVKALHALNMAHTGLELFTKQLEERIECKGQVPVVETKPSPTFLPSIHLLWTPLMGSMNDWRTPVLEEAIECLGDILLLAPGFLARRFYKDAWPKLKEFVEHGAPKRNLIVPGHDDMSSPALDARMQRAVLRMIIHLVSKLTQEDCANLFLPISRELLRDIIRISRKNEDKRPANPIHDISDTLRDCYAAIASVNPDAAWAILYDHGGISHDRTFTGDISDLHVEKASAIIASLKDLPMPQSTPSQWDILVFEAMQPSLSRAI